MNVLIDHGTDQRPFHDGPLVRAVDIDVVRSEFYKSYAAEGTDKQKAAARRQAFNRAINEAQALTFGEPFARPEEAGLSIARIEVDDTGRIVVVVGPPEPPAGGGDRNPWDELYAKNEERPS